MKIHFQPPPPPPPAATTQPKALPTAFEVEQATQELIEKARQERERREKRKNKKTGSGKNDLTPRAAPGPTPEILALLISLQEKE